MIDRDDNIFITIHRIGDLVGVHISGGDMGTILIPFPFPRLFVSGGVGVGGQHDRVAGANLRRGKLCDRSRRDSEVVNRGKGAFATTTGHFHGELVSEGVIGQAGKVGRDEAVGLTGRTRNVIAIVLPLIIDGDVTAVLNHSGESHQVILAGVVRTNDIGRHIRRHRENHSIGLIQVINLAVQIVCTYRVARNPKGWSYGICTIAVEIPPIGGR